MVSGSGEWESDCSAELRVPMKFIRGKRAALLFAYLKSSSDTLLALVLNIFFHVEKFGSTPKTKQRRTMLPWAIRPSVVNGVGCSIPS